MNLVDLLKIKYPTITFLSDVILQDDGNGPYIKKWSILNTPQPSDKDIQSWMTDPTILDLYNKSQNEIANQIILDKLQEIDLQSIRPLRENDTQKITELEQQATALRVQLLPTADVAVDVIPAEKAL